MRLGVIYGRAASLANVAEDILVTAMRAGYAPVPHEQEYYPKEVVETSDAAIIVMCSAPAIAGPYMVLYSDLKRNYKFPVLWYAMVEGEIPKQDVQSWMIRDIEFVAVSEYVAGKLMEAGFRVRDVVHHGVRKDLVSRALSMVRKTEGKKTVIVISHSHMRKGLPLLKEALLLLAEKRDDYEVVVHTDDRGAALLSGVPHVQARPLFGKQPRHAVYARIAAADVLVHPALAEGFGLPVLEANALGVPAVHVALPPIMEFSDPQVNYVVDVEDIETVDSVDGVRYELHYYKPEDMAAAIDAALSASKDELEEKKARAVRVLETHDAEVLYARLINSIMGNHGRVPVAEV